MPRPKRKALASAASAIRRVAPAYPVRLVGVFGSVARGDEGPASDLDVVALFDEGRTTRDVLGFCVDLEDAVGREVNLVTSLDGISAAFASELERDLVVAYERQGRTPSCRRDVDAALDEAERAAHTSPLRLTHEEVFGWAGGTLSGAEAMAAFGLTGEDLELLEREAEAFDRGEWPSGRVTRLGGVGRGASGA